MLIRPLDHPVDVPALLDLFERCRSDDGQPPLSEHKYASLTGERLSGAGFVVEDDGSTVGYLHLLESQRSGTYELEIAVASAKSDFIEGRLVEVALEHVRGLRGNEVHAWVYQGGSSRSLESLGFDRVRTLHQLRVQLPVERSPIPPGVAFTEFDQADEEAFLDLTNRAFRGHLDTGNWSTEDLHERQAYEWFDPAGVRMVWEGSRLVAVCWTKQHPRGIGEIYLIASDPDRRGSGFGRAAALEGLRFLSEAGSSVGMLYVDASNDGAHRLYEQLGFEKHHTDLAYGLKL